MVASCRDENMRARAGYVAGGLVDQLDNLPTLYEPPRERQRRFPFVTTLSERCTARERRRREFYSLRLLRTLNAFCAQAPERRGNNSLTSGA